MADLTELRELAKAATPGPWTASPHTWGVGIEAAEDEQLFVESYGLTHDTNGGADAAFIAAANPATILSLLDRLEAAEAAVERVRGLVADGGDYHYYVTDGPDGEYVQEGSPCVAVDDLLHALDGGESDE